MWVSITGAVLESVAFASLVAGIVWTIWVLLRRRQRVTEKKAAKLTVWLVVGVLLLVFEITRHLLKW